MGKISYRLLYWEGTVGERITEMGSWLVADKDAAREAYAKALVALANFQLIERGHR